MEVADMIRRATVEDIEILMELDTHVEREEFESKLELGRVLVYEVDDKIVGIIRYNMFWDQYPFLNYFKILEPYRHRGYGTEMINYWETEMMALGNYLVMTSGRADQDAQHFFRALGYQDSGNILFPGENLELILIKNLIR